MSTQPLISIVISVYNLSDCVSRCLESIVTQDYSELEIIVVNDGSTDDSLSIIESFAKRDPRIIIIDRPNGGLATTRQQGALMATGEYIHFFDGDDSMEPDLYSCAIKQIIDDERPDMVLMPFWFCRSDNSFTPSKEYPTGIETGKQLFHFILSNHSYYNVWQYLFKRSLFDESIKVVPELYYGEDILYTLQLTYKSNRVSFYRDKPLIHYIIRKTSITGRQPTQKDVDNYGLLTKTVSELLMGLPDCNDLPRQLKALEIKHFAFLIKCGVAKDLPRKCREIMALMKDDPNILSSYNQWLVGKIIRDYARCPLLGYIRLKRYQRRGKTTKL